MTGRRLAGIGAVAALLLGAVTAGSAAAQAAAVPTRPLSPVEVEFTEEFTQVTSVRELSNLRIIVSDAGERVVKLLAGPTAAAVAVGRQGPGPGEYMVPGSLLSGPGDTTWLTDVGARRLLVIGPGGTAGGTIAYGDTAGDQRTRMLIPISVDRSGRLYAIGYAVALGMRTGGASVQFPDSIPIVRFAPRASARDTLAWLQQPRMQMEMSGGRGAPTQMRSTGLSPFAAREAWAVASDGSVAIVRVSPYRVDWVSPTGVKRSGPVLPHTPQRVTEADKAAVVAEMQAQIRMATGSMQMPAGFDPMSLISGMEFPETKPPFIGGAHVSPEGRVWIPATPARYGDPITYDVVDSRGVLVERVQMPPKTRVVGFSGRSLYTVRIDDDDLQYVQRRRP